MPGVLTGGVDAANAHAIDWGPQGLIAYGSHSSVVVVHPISAVAIQTLQGHKSNVLKVKWARCCEEVGTAEAVVASGDAEGRVVVWDVGSGVERRPLAPAPAGDGRGGVGDLGWRSPKLLLALLRPHVLILWDVQTGDRLWRKAFTESLGSFDIDPFSPDNLAFLSKTGNLMLVEGVCVASAPTGEGRVFRLKGNESPTEKGGGTGGGRKGVISRGVAQLMGVVTDQEAPQPTATGDECISARYSPAARHVLYLLSPRQLLLLDTQALQTLAHVILDPNISPFFQILPCSLREAVYFIQEHGCVTLRLHSQKGETEKAGGMDMALEAVASSDSQRVSKSYRVSGVALEPTSQASFCLLMSTGRLLIYSLVGSASRGRPSSLEELVQLSPELRMSLGQGKLGMVLGGMASGLGGAGSVVRWRPRVEEEGLGDGEWAGVGTAEGSLQLVRVDEGRLEREWAVHGAPVRCLEWGGPFHIVTAAYTPTLSTSSVVRNELVVTDVRTGLSETLRPDAEESPISIISVSFYYTYLAISFRDQPMEIWHLKDKRLLRRMSKACPVIIDMAWSGKHHQAHILKSEKEGTENEPPSPNVDLAQIAGKEREQTVYRENLVVLDNENHLYHVVVKGMHVKDGKEVNTQWSTASSINAMVWKGDLLAFGDSEGRVSVWDLGAKQSRLSSGPSRGSVRRLQFSPYKGDMTLAVLHSDGVSIWNAANLTIVEQVRTGVDGLGGALRVVDVDVGPSGAPLLLTSDGALRLFDPSLSVQTSPVSHARLASAFASSLLPPTFTQTLRIFLRDPSITEIYQAATILEAVEKSELRRGEKELILCQLKRLFEEFPELENELCTATKIDRFRIAAGLCGRGWEADLWRVMGSGVLPPSLDVAWPSPTFRRWETLRRGCLGSGAAADGAEGTERLIAAGEVEAAVSRLLSQAAPSYSDSLLACLLSALSAGSDASTQSTVKLVATSLIASGRLAEGTQLLCLIGKSKDAARYLQSNAQWEKAAWLAKLSLDVEDVRDILLKWADHLCSPFVDRKRLSLLVYASAGVWTSVVERLSEWGEAGVAASVATAAEWAAEAEASRSVWADYARLLSGLGLFQPALHYADKAGPNGLPITQRIRLLQHQSSPTPTRSPKE